jgi:hypothetical protein
MPPLVLVGGYDFNDPIQCSAHGQKSGCKAYSFDGGVHTFIGSRSTVSGQRIIIYYCYSTLLARVLEVWNDYSTHLCLSNYSH